MKLEQFIHQYIAYRKSLGEKFRTNEVMLKAFYKSVGANLLIESVTENAINNFLYSTSKSVTSGWFCRHTALLGFYKYALARNYITTIPLPKVLPKRPEPFVPYIYSRKELKNIFDCGLTYQKNQSFVKPYMVRNILILTYAIGLRLHETLEIKLEDIDLDNRVITVKESKFYKSRLLPFNDQLANIIREYLLWRKLYGYPQNMGAYLFVGSGNDIFKIDTMRGIFERIRTEAGIKRADKATFQPRIHDLRHTFAVNRLISWYQQNKDVQQLLPILSTYLGHTHLAHTTVYLSMTNDLLKEANIRFEKYKTGEQL